MLGSKSVAHNSKITSNAVFSSETVRIKEIEDVMYPLFQLDVAHALRRILETEHPFIKILCSIQFMECHALDIYLVKN